MKKDDIEKRKTAFFEITDGKIGQETVERLDEMGFFTAPASIHFHGAYEGGLFDHSLAVTEHLVRLTERNLLQWKRHGKLAPVIVGMFHDLCKCDTYIMSGNGNIRWNPNTELQGHGTKSVILAKRLVDDLSDEETMCIRYHMGAFTSREEWGDYTAAVRRYPNVLWTHQADMLASHVDGV